ncbi:VWA domain-containing protein [Sorangium sp. So ce1024]|uniref:VWA domain-containing protein n=1 Tax=unclassified Sorangium TaxID=2621164 RepID=UPI003F099146
MRSTSTGIYFCLIAAGVLAPLQAGAADIDASGGITLTVNFITAPNPNKVPGSGAAEMDYCEIFEGLGRRLWMQTEGTHYVRGVRFIQAPASFASDIQWYTDGDVPGVGTFGRVAPGFPQSWMEYHEDPTVGAGGDDFRINLLAHETGHLLYGLFDEYRATWFGSLGVCSGWDASTPATIQYCDTHSDCTAAPWTGTCVFSRSCLNSPGTACRQNSDCGMGTRAICMGSTTRGDTQPPDRQIDFCQNETNLTAGGGVDRDRVCQMQNTITLGRWCDGSNHLHSTTFNGQDVVMLDGSFDDYNCWTFAATGSYIDASGSPFFPTPFRGHVDIANKLATRTLGVYTDAATLDAAYPLAAGALDCDFLVNPVDPADNTYLLVDSSGSMAYSDFTGRLAADVALEGASFFYNATSPGRFAGIATYNTATTELVGWGAVGAVGPLATTAAGMTNIADAIDQAASAIRGGVSSGGPNNNLNIVVLSDGKQTVEGDPIAAARRACSGDVPITVNTISYGDADISQLEAIAAECGGFAWVAGAKDASQGGGGFDQPNPREMRTALARSKFHLRRESEVLEEIAFLAGTEVEARSFFVPAGTSALDFAWLGNHAETCGQCIGEIVSYRPSFPLVEYELVGPDGVVHDASLSPDPDELMYARARVSNPVPGNWTARVTTSAVHPSDRGKLEMTWLGWVENGDLAAKAWVANPRTAVDRPVTLLASLRYPMPATNLSVHAVVTHRGTEVIVPMLDDGAHGDGEPADGVYGGLFNEAGVAQPAGAYRVKVTLIAVAGQATTVPGEYAEPVAIGVAPGDAVVHAETMFRLSDAFVLDPGDPDGRAGRLELGFTELEAGQSYTDLQMTVLDFPVHEDVLRVSLGPDITISNVRVDCLTCGTTNGTYEARVTFDADVAETAIEDRPAAIQRGVRSLRSVNSVDIRCNAPPVLELQESGPFQICESGSRIVALTPPVVTRSCSPSTITGQVIASNNPAVSTPAPVAATGEVSLPIGTHTIAWTATDERGGQATVQQDVVVLAGVYATNHLNVRDRARIEAGSGVFAAAASGGTTEIGRDGQLGDLWSQGDVSLRPHARVHGDLYTAGALSKEPGARVDGATSTAHTIALPPANMDVPAFPAGPAPDVHLEPHKVESRAPGSYGTVTVQRGATLKLSAGAYFVKRLRIEPNANVEITGDVTLNVQSELTLQGTLSAPVFLGYHGSDPVVVQSTFDGALVAPSADVYIRADFEGLLSARGIIVDSDRALRCSATALPVHHNLLRAEGAPVLSGDTARGAAAERGGAGCSISTGRERGTWLFALLPALGVMLRRARRGRRSAEGSRL